MTSRRIREAIDTMVLNRKLYKVSSRDAARTTQFRTARVHLRCRFSYRLDKGNMTFPQTHNPDRGVNGMEKGRLQMILTNKRIKHQYRLSLRCRVNIFFIPP